MDIPAAEAAALVHRPVIVETADGPEEQLKPVFAHEVFAVALAGDHVTVVTIDGQKLLGSMPTHATKLEPNTPAAKASPEAALPDAPHPELQPAGEASSPAASEAAGDATHTHPAEGGDVSAETGATSVAPDAAQALATAAAEATKAAPSRGKPAASGGKSGGKAGGKNGGAK